MVLGVGHFGIVREGTHKYNCDKIFAIKSIEKRKVDINIA
jgi:hypothetical protein